MKAGTVAWAAGCGNLDAGTGDSTAESGTVSTGCAAPGTAGAGYDHQRFRRCPQELKWLVAAATADAAAAASAAVAAT